MATAASTRLGRGIGLIAVAATAAGLGLSDAGAAVPTDVHRDARAAAAAEGPLAQPGSPAGRRQASGAEWHEQTPAQSPPPNSSAAMAHDAGTSQMIMFGGYGVSRGATWAWDGSTWKDLELDAAPSGRNDTAMTYDPVRDAIVLYGGFQTSEPENDTWTFADGEWSQLPIYGANLLQHAMDFDPHLNQPLLFGGTYDYGEYYNWTWTLDQTDWQALQPATVPPGRIEPGLAYAPKRDALVMFGGWGPDVLRDTWTWDGTDWSLEEMRRSPSARASVAMATFGERVALFGGYSDAGVAGNHVWILKKHAWKRLNLDPAPPSRGKTVFEWDPVRQEAVLFGGEGVTKDLSDTWTLTP